MSPLVSSSSVLEIVPLDPLEEFESCLFPEIPLIKSLPEIVSLEPSGYVMVAVPSSPTVTWLPDGRVSLLALVTLVLTWSFSLSVK